MITVDYIDNGVLVTFEAFGQTATATASTPSNAAYKVAHKFLENLSDKYLGEAIIYLYTDAGRAEAIISMLNAAAADGFTVKICDNVVPTKMYIFDPDNIPEGFIEYGRNVDRNIVWGMIPQRYCEGASIVPYDERFMESVRCRRIYIDSIGIEKKSSNGDMIYLLHKFTFRNDEKYITKITMGIAEDHISLMNCDYRKATDKLAWQICASLLNRQPKLV